ncbi:MAG: helix-turn-helix domain-containing protein [Deltaproteobacteria bacterium]|nr:helix-turn-helix domain-containing protein [Deltaproteobacteria bacterium]
MEEQEVNINNLDIERMVNRNLILTIPETAEILKIAPQTIRNQLCKGEFPIKRFKNVKPVRFRMTDVLKYINED